MIGSLFSGVDGLALGLERATGQQVAWQCELDRAASTVLAERWPGVPNLHDITAVDWAGVEPVEIVCGGPPCQPTSSAGLRKGEADERWMWPAAIDAVRHLRPRWIMFENPPSLLTLHGGRPFGRILAALAEMGYVGRWGCVRASDIGAPHRRERLFLVATDTRDRAEHRERPRTEPRQGGPVIADANRSSRWPVGQSLQGDGPATHGGRGSTEPGGCRGSAADASCPGAGRNTGAPPVAKEPPRRGKSNDADPPVAGGATAADADGRGQQGGPELDSNAQRTTADGRGRRRHVDRCRDVDWGRYEPAIRRWEFIHGPAPAPVDDRGRLSPAFVEWMMGFPPGWVTDTAISRSAQLRCLGNAVVPHCAEMAWHLLSSAEVAA